MNYIHIKYPVLHINHSDSDHESLKICMTTQSYLTYFKGATRRPLELALGP